MHLIVKIASRDVKLAESIHFLMLLFALLAMMAIHLLVQNFFFINFKVEFAFHLKVVLSSINLVYARLVLMGITLISNQKMLSLTLTTITGSIIQNNAQNVLFKIVKPAKARNIIQLYILLVISVPFVSQTTSGILKLKHVNLHAQLINVKLAVIQQHAQIVYLLTT